MSVSSTISRPNSILYMEQGDKHRPRTTRPTIYGLKNTVSSGHWLTSQAAQHLLASGGNAFDAIVAGIFTAAVVEPTSSFSLGSECVYMLHAATSDGIQTLCGQGGAPLAASPDYFEKNKIDEIPTGPGKGAPLAFTTPGMVGSALSLLSRYGTRPLHEVLAPAIECAQTGFANYEYMNSRLEPEALEQFKLFGADGADIFFPSGKVPTPGAIMRQPALAKVLCALSTASRAEGLSREAGIAAARAEFYSGGIGHLIAENSRRVGGLLDEADLEQYSESYEEPVKTEFAGVTVHGQSFWSQAPVMMQVLNILKGFDLTRFRHNSPEYVHIVVEASKLAFADREAFYGDPSHVTVPSRGLLDGDYGLERAKMIRLWQAAEDLPDPGAPWVFSGERPVPISKLQWAERPLEMDRVETGTTHLSVVDVHGNMVCATASGGAFIKSVFFDDLGFTLSTRSEMFNLTRGHPNCIAPGKRPRTSLVNYIVAKDGVPIMTVGCPGGDAQVQANIQILLNAVVWGMPPQEAVEAPRFATMSVPNSFYPHSYAKGYLALEEGFPDSVIEALASMGHKPATVATCGMGAVITRRNPETGVIATSSDPRRSCHALGW